MCKCKESLEARAQKGFINVYEAQKLQDCNCEDEPEQKPEPKRKPQNRSKLKLFK